PRGQGAAAGRAGAAAFLVGTPLWRAPDPAAKLAELVSRPLVKVCGLTRAEDVEVAVDAGADLVGFILARETPRRAPRVLDAPDTVLRVAVFVEETEETGADLVQLYRRENGHRGRGTMSAAGLYGTYGGRYVPETLIPALDELEAGWRAALADESYRAELDRLGRTYAGRPTPLTRAERFAPGKRLYLKREDLLHTGAHKLNNALGQAEPARP